MQSSEAHEETGPSRPMDFIALSGVALRNHKGVWSLQDGYSFHDAPPTDSDDHTETFKLLGGIRAIYNHTRKCWHVLPPSAPISLPRGEIPRTGVGSTEHAQYDKNERAAGAASSLYLSKKVLVTEMGSAFHAIMDLFGQTRSISSKKRIGSDMTNQAMGHLIRGRFCTALSHLVLDGLRPYRLQGIVQDDIWKVTVAFCNAAASDPTSLLASSSMDKIIFQPMNALRTTMKDNDVKFRTFVSLAMSKGLLTGWLEALPQQTNVLQKYYLPSAFLVLVGENETYLQLYQEMLLTLEPMIYLPFDLTIDFESRYMAPSVTSSSRDHAALSLYDSNVSSSLPDLENSDSSTSNTLMDQPVSQLLRPSVVIKTYADTGQRTASGNVLNAVWDITPISSPSHSPTHRTPVQRNHASMSETGDIGRTPLMSRGSVGEEEEWEGQFPIRLSLEQFQPAAIKGKFQKFKGSLLKTFSDGFQHLNKGGAITGIPPGMGDQTAGENQTQKLVTTPRPTATTGERVVEALYTNICDDADELCFQKGDHLIVKEQINEEWLICSDGNKSGIVPVNYITLVS